MEAFWIKFGFFAFVLAPIWATGLWFLAEAFIKNRYVSEPIQTLMATIALQTFVADLFFLFIGVVADNHLQAFIAVWNFMWHGMGIWWWIWSVLGFVVATIARFVTDSNEELYVKRVFLCTMVVAFVHGMVLFLNYVATALTLIG